MKIAVLSNTLNPHMKPLADEMYKIIGNDFKYIEGYDIEDERKIFGWTNSDRVPYLMNISNKKQTDECIRIILDYDAIVFGANPYMYHLIKDRIAEGKLTYLQTERLFKRSIIQILYPPRALSLMQQRVLTSWKKNVHVLAASAYLTWDYRRIGANTDRIYKFGYHVNTIEDITISKHCMEKDVKLACLGRLVGCKNFDDAIKLVGMLSSSGINAQLEIGGTGPVERELRELAKSLSIEDRIHFKGNIQTSEVKEFMLNTDIFLFTSGLREGWGVTLNEAMAHGCAVVANDAAGSTPWLIDDMENGMIYKHGNMKSLYKKTETLINDQNLFQNVRQNALSTIKNEWNAVVAAERLISVISKELSGKKITFSEGIMSKAEIFKNNYYSS